MKKQFAIIGLSSFTRRILEQIETEDCEILLIDKDPKTIDAYKDRVQSSYIADVLNESTIGQLIPPDIDAVIVDPGDRIEVSILVTNYLKKLGVQKIFVRADTEEHGEILSLIGAEHIIYPNKEAAQRLAPILMTSHLISYMPLSNEMVLAEVKAPPAIIGKRLIESGIRDVQHLNVVAIRGDKTGQEYSFISPDYLFSENDILLLAGNEKNLMDFSDKAIIRKNKGIRGFLKGMISDSIQ